MKRRRVLFIQLSQLKLFIRKFLIVLVFVSALGLMLFSKADTAVLNKSVSAVSSVIYPLMNFVQLPAAFTYKIYQQFSDIASVYQENKRLKNETAEIFILKNKLNILKAENKILSKMLAYTPPPEVSYVTAKIIAEQGSGFSHAVFAYISDEQPVRKGQIVLAQGNVIGRVDFVNGNYAHILLMTDISSKIPVMNERNHARGILSGNNTSTPNLLFTTLEADVQKGDRLITSGVSGIFPTGLPIGKISKVRKGSIEVEPLTKTDSLEYVTIVDYGLYEDILNASIQNGDD